jgi:hypothetical protein
MPNIDPTTGPAIHVWLSAGPGPGCGVVVGSVEDVAVIEAALAVELAVDSAAVEAVQAPPEPDPDKH